MNPHPGFTPIARTSARRPRPLHRLAPVPTGAPAEVPVLSLVIPMFNEQDVLPLCVARLQAVLAPLALAYELLFVDDGSTDASVRTLASLAAQHPQIRVIRLSRNFGKEAAMTAGLDHARGDAVILLDADLQDPPELIPDMLAAWRAGAEVVTMRRRTRAGETWLKRSSAHLYYRLLNRLSAVPIPADTGDFRLLSRRALQALQQLPERNRYMKGLFAWIGLPTTDILYDRAARAAGHSRWGWTGLMRLAIDGITSFSVAPLRAVSWLGLAVLLASGAGLIWLLASASPQAAMAVPLAGVGVLGGLQLLALGLLGEYVGRTYLEVKQRPVYLIHDIWTHPGTTATPLTDWTETPHVATP